MYKSVNFNNIHIHISDKSLELKTEELLNKMASIGLNIKIPKQSLINLTSMLGKRVIVRYNGGRVVQGQLKSYDRSLNLILHKAIQLKIDIQQQEDRQLGLIIVKGSQIYSINSKDKCIRIENPFEQELQQQEQIHA